MTDPFRLNHELPIGMQLTGWLRDQIVTGKMAPGVRLSEQEIAKATGMSRQPVREAFIKLSGEKLVEIRPQRGTFVCKISMKDVMVSRFVREAVEADIVTAAAQNASADHVSELQAAVAEQHASRAMGGAVFMQLDEQFHRLLCLAAGQGAVWHHLEPIKMHMDRVRYLTAEQPPDHLIAQHADIVDAIAAQDPARAEEALRIHLRGVLKDLPELQIKAAALFQDD
ncbi:GntR family transcriptional regulator [Sagittula sp. SSi028]|uniref:GntR family transcriptional regulator n=1 Tax=Sagittula sp. SSi028 TaxID=3400636 RepID=UPI003AF757AA